MLQDGEVSQGTSPDGRSPLGVLFVHGIGSQRRGGTLVECADAIVEWVSSWMSGFYERWTASPEFSEIRKRLRAGVIDEPQMLEELRVVAAVTGCRELFAEIAVHSAWLQPEPADASAPPSARLRLAFTGLDGESRSEEWLLAEAHWADAFLPPRFAEFARWALQVVPWTLQAQFGTRLRRGIRLSLGHRGWRPLSLLAALLRPLLYIGYLVAAMAMAVVVQALLLLLLLVAAIPIGWVRELVRKAQQAIGSSLGDSFVLIQSPVQCAAIVEKVRRDLAWMAARCRKVVVVAHSQGAAVAHMALSENPPAELRRLITLGSGLGKLHELRALITRSGALGRAWLMLACLVVIVVLGPGMLTAQATGDDPWGGELRGFLVLGAVMGLLLGVFLSGYSGVEQARDRLRLPGLPEPDGWSDYFTSADPVPNGRLFDEPPDWIRSREVHNAGSAFADHTSYWRNRDGFVGLVVEELAEEAGVPLVRLCADDGERLQRARWRRRWRVRWLGAARLAFGVGAIAAAWRLREAAGGLGRPVYEAVQSAAARLRGQALDGAAELVETLRLNRPEVTGWVLIAAAAALWSWLLGFLWRRWESRDVARLFARRELDAGGLPFVLFVTFAALPPLLAAVLWLPSGPALASRALARAPAAGDLFWTSLAVSFGAVVVWDSFRNLVLRRAPKAPADLFSARTALMFTLATLLLLAVGLLQPATQGPASGRMAAALAIAVATAELWSKLVQPRVSRRLVSASTHAPPEALGRAPSRLFSLAGFSVAMAVFGLLFAVFAWASVAGRFTLALLGGMFAFLTLKQARGTDRASSVVAAVAMAVVALTALILAWPALRQLWSWVE